MPHRRPKPPRRIIAALIAVYVIGFVLTFGHESVRFDACRDCWPDAEAPYIFGVLAGMGWPIYMPMRLSYLYFRGSK